MCVKGLLVCIFIKPTFYPCCCILLLTISTSSLFEGPLQDTYTLNGLSSNDKGQQQKAKKQLSLSTHLLEDNLIEYNPTQKKNQNECVSVKATKPSGQLRTVT